jgi:hypothetical protein
MRLLLVDDIATQSVPYLHWQPKRGRSSPEGQINMTFKRKTTTLSARG